VAEALGLQGEAAADPQRLVGWLLEQPTLLVLDNCEHLNLAAAELAQHLLAACPELHLLATSRQRLGITGEIASELQLSNHLIGSFILRSCVMLVILRLEPF
jgi:predicted ATPase